MKISLTPEHFTLQGCYDVYIQPRSEGGDLPENTSYNANHERLYSSDSFLSDAGRLCEKGETTSWGSFTNFNCCRVIILFETF